MPALAGLRDLLNLEPAVAELALSAPYEDARATRRIGPEISIGEAL